MGSVESSIALNSSNSVNYCQVCKGPSTKKCSRCCTAYYCSTEHQKTDWANKHKELCLEDPGYKLRTFPIKFQVVNDEGSRKTRKHILASRNIRKGEIVLKESTIMSGPRWGLGKQDKICLGCYQIVDPNSTAYTKCSKCQWTICSKKCEESHIHANYECSILAERNIKENHGLMAKTGCLITLLRCCLLKQRNPTQWDCLMDIENYFDHFGNDDKIIKLSHELLKFFQIECGLQGTELTDVQNLIGITNFNSRGANCTIGPRSSIQQEDNTATNIFHYLSFVDTAFPETVNVEVKEKMFAQPYRKEVILKATKDIRSGERIVEIVPYDLEKREVRLARLRDALDIVNSLSPEEREALVAASAARRSY